MDPESTTGAPAGLLSRLAALFYDVLLAIAIAFVATVAMLPLAHGEAILTSTLGFVGHLYHAVLLVAVFAYFGWCWTHRGQTLGMKAWRIHLQTPAHLPIGWATAMVRYVLGVAFAMLAILGVWYLTRPGTALVHLGAVAMLMPAILNYAWVLCDAARRTLIDIACRSRVVRIA